MGIDVYSPHQRPVLCFYCASNNLSPSQHLGAGVTLLHPLALREAENLLAHLTDEETEA